MTVSSVIKGETEEEDSLIQFGEKERVREEENGTERESRQRERECGV